MLSKLFLAAGITAQAMASTTIRVNVGQKQLAFTPETITASMGDVVEFHFFQKNHSVVQGDFNSPCNPATTRGFYSGFFPTNGTGQNAKVFSVNINDTNPIVFYCSQNIGTHCASGMVGVINPSNSSSLQSYKDGAKAVQTAVSPASVFGGVVGNAPAESTTTGSGGTPTATTNPNAASSRKVSLAGLAAVAVAALYVM